MAYFHFEYKVVRKYQEYKSSKGICYNIDIYQSRGLLNNISYHISQSYCKTQVAKCNRYYNDSVKFPAEIDQYKEGIERICEKD